MRIIIRSLSPELQALSRWDCLVQCILDQSRSSEIRSLWRKPQLGVHSGVNGDEDMLIHLTVAVRAIQQIARHARQKYPSGHNSGKGKKANRTYMLLSLPDRVADAKDPAARALSEEFFVVCNPAVEGFCLRAKKWGKSC